MSPAVPAALTVLATVLAAQPHHSRRRLARLAAVARTRTASRPSHAAVPLVAGAAAVVIGLAAGAVAGVCAAGIVAFLGRRRPPTSPPPDLALVADLIATCLAAGAVLPDALRAAAEASPAAAATCLPVADRLLAGAPPGEAWADWLGRPELAPMARACVRAADSGAATTQELRRAGERIRAQRRAELAHRAQRAGVWAVLPLGLCFLPAFVLVGIVPFALGLFGR
jgi:pilus assembly protein TadC